MIVERSMSPQFLSNAYLVCDGAGGPAFFVDAGGPAEPLIEAAQRLSAQPTHVLLTHHHFDHVSELSALCERWKGLQVLAHPRERELLDDVAARAAGARLGSVEEGGSLRFGELEVRPLHTPGHTAGMLSFLVLDRSTRSPAPPSPAISSPSPAISPASPSPASSPAPPSPAAAADLGGGEAAVFTGDTLFRGSVGGVRAPGHTTYADLRDSIMDTLMELSRETVVYPGHTERTTVGEEWEHNPFIRLWRGVVAEGAEECTALGEPATLILLASDYDGGKKAWVRWPDGSDDIVPGSRVELSG